MKHCDLLIELMWRDFVCDRGGVRVGGGVYDENDVLDSVIYFGGAG